MVKNNRKHGVFAVEKSFNISLQHDVEADRRDAMTVVQALKIVFRQMELSGSRPRTIETYSFAFKEFQGITGVVYVEDIDAEMIYDYLNSIDVAKVTKLVRLKSLKAVLNRFFDNRWIEYKFWTNIRIRIDKTIKKGAKENDIEILLSLIDRMTYIGFRDTVAILILYRTGIRINTLGELRENHIDMPVLFSSRVK